MTRLYQVDAFTRESFRGNPAAVCLLEQARPDPWMQSLAAEMNLSETAFLLREGDGWRLRWFTSVKEVTLCGHATLASAHVLFSQGLASEDVVIRFETLSGTLTAQRLGEWLQLDFPVRYVTPAAPDDAVWQALGQPHVLAWYDAPTVHGKFLLELDSAEAVRALSPDFIRLAASGARGLIVTAPSDDPAFDFVSRFFAPHLGVNEDPVTGSAHCTLAPFWSTRLGKSVLTGYQASARAGVVVCEPRGERVLLRGQAVTIFEGGLAECI